MRTAQASGFGTVDQAPAGRGAGGLNGSILGESPALTVAGSAGGGPDWGSDSTGSMGSSVSPRRTRSISVPSSD